MSLHLQPKPQKKEGIVSIIRNAVIIMISEKLSFRIY